MKTRNKYKIGGGVLLLLLLTSGVAASVIPGLDNPPPASAEGPAPGVAGDNPCSNREEQNAETARAYYAVIGEELKKRADALLDENPNLTAEQNWIVDLAGYNGSDEWITWIRDELVNPATAAEAYVPGEAYDAYTYWCPGWDVAEDGSKTERKPELVHDYPLHYQAGKAYWVLYQDEDVTIAILKDCHNLVIIKNPPPPPPEETTTTVPGTTIPPTTVVTTPPPPPPPTTQPPVTTPPTTAPPVTTPPETTVPPSTTPPTTAPPVTVPPTTAPPPTTECGNKCHPATTVAPPPTTVRPAPTAPPVTDPPLAPDDTQPPGAPPPTVVNPIDPPHTSTPDGHSGGNPSGPPTTVATPVPVTQPSGGGATPTPP